MIRALLSAIFLLGVLSAADAQPKTQAKAPGKIQAVDIVSAGLYTLGKSKEIKTTTISTGQRTEAETVKLIKRTSTIQPKEDLVFGIEAVISGAPRNAQVPVRIVWHYPQPGLRNPNTNETKLTDEYEQQRVIGETAAFYWKLGPAWTQVAGEWSIELWDGERLVAKQVFLLQP